jgi:hypothetical protein
MAAFTPPLAEFRQQKSLPVRKRIKKEKKE